MEKIKKVSVIGSGLMGRQIALNAQLHGFTVTLTDSSADALEAAKKWTKEYLDGRVSKGKMDKAVADDAFNKLQFIASTQQAVEGADLVIEAIIEKVEVKRALFQDLGKWVSNECILSTNSSFIPSSNFKNDVPNPARLVNLHYFNPAMVMQLVEIVRGDHTSDETVKTLQEFVKAIEKLPVTVNKEVPGFVVNRLLRAAQNEAFYLLENEIASFQDIDIGAEKGLNWPMGPFRLQDFTGLDLSYHSRTEKFKETGDPKDAPPKELVKRYERGDYGRKTGKGWYTYDKK